MTAYGNRRIDPRNNTEYPNTAQDPELHTIAEFEEFPGQYGFQLRFRPKSGTLTITEDTGGTAYNLVTTTPLAGQIQVDYTSGYCFANFADAGQLAFCQFDGLGANLSVANVTAMASSGPATTKGDIAVYNGLALARLGSSSDGSLIIDNAAASTGRKALAPGADYSVLRSRAGASDKVEYALITSFPKEQYYPLDRSVQGMLPTIDSGDTDHDWSISPGWCWDDTFTKVIYNSSAKVKQADTTWAVGTGTGGLRSGLTFSSGTSYFIWAILRSDTGVTDFLIDTSSTSPTLPANYDYKRLIGAFKTQSGVASNISVINSIEGNSVRSRLTTIVNEVNVSNLGTSRTSYTCADVPSYDGLVAELLTQMLGSSGTNYGIVTSLDQTDSTPSSTLYTHRFGSTFGADVVLDLRLNGSAQFGARSDKTSTTLQAFLLSYRFPRVI